MRQHARGDAGQAARDEWVRGRLAVAAVALVAVFAMLAGSGNAAVDRAGKQVAGPQLSVGVTLPLTGNTADFGNASNNGAILAAAQINAKGGVDGKPLKMYYEDMANDPAKAVTTFNQLTSVNHVPVILTGTSNGVLAQGPLAAQTKTVLVNGAASTPLMRAFGQQHYFFSVINDSTEEALALMKYIKGKLHAKQVAMVYSNEPIGQGAKTAFTTAAKEYGVAITNTIALDATNFDYRQQIGQLQGLHPGIVVVASYYDPVGYLLQQAGQAGFHTTWIGGQTTINPSTLVRAGSAANGYITVRPAYDANLAASGNNPTKAFEQAYKAKFGIEPTNYSAHYYDALNLVAKIVNQIHSTDPTKIEAALHKITPAHPYQGVAGPIAFDADGMVNQPAYVFQIENGQVVPATPPATPLTATLSANGQALLKPTTGLFAGSYAITVNDTSAKDGFFLKGPRVAESTTAKFKGKVVWKLNLAAGTYAYGSLTNSKARGHFTVGR